MTGDDAAQPPCGVRASTPDWQAAGIAATDARLCAACPNVDCVTFFEDPDGTRLEVTNWRLARRRRAAHWEGSPA